jgi:hypothetical protein
MLDDSFESMRVFPTTSQLRVAVRDWQRRVETDVKQAMSRSAHPADRDEKLSSRPQKAGNWKHCMCSLEMVLFPSQSVW